MLTNRVLIDEDNLYSLQLSLGKDLLFLLTISDIYFCKWAEDIVEACHNGDMDAIQSTSRDLRHFSTLLCAEQLAYLSESVSYQMRLGVGVSEDELLDLLRIAKETNTIFKTYIEKILSKKHYT